MTLAQESANVQSPDVAAVSHGEGGALPRSYDGLATALVAPSARSREYEFTDRDFDRVRAMIHARAGIALSDSKREMVYSRLARRLRTLGLDSFDRYLSLLDDRDAPEWQDFTNALTTNLTGFFREPHHFPILARHAARVPPGRAIRLWCAGASTGEEPYSIAMALAEQFDTLSPPVKILATDIDTRVLQEAEAGIYPLERVEKLDPARLRRFFLQGQGSRSGHVRVRPELRELISFRPLNLMAPRWPIRGELDAIFCRNVMIYFDKPTQLSILEKFAPLLRPNGLLFAGHSESLHHAAHVFRLTGKTVYQRLGAGDAALRA